MPLVDRHWRAMASALLVTVVLGAASDAVRAQHLMGVEAERRAVQLERLRIEQRLRVERGMAHAQMPSTMYASTPDPAPPPHAVPLDIKRAPAPEGAAAQDPAVRSAPGPGHRIPLFVSASDASAAEGYVRIINRSDGAGEVRIEGYDDAGVRHGPVTLSVGAGEAVHLSATDLEQGSAAKGLTGRLGSGEGDWRLEMTSALDIEVLAYVRGGDGFLSAMHDVVPRDESGHRVVWFNAGGEVVQASRLRVINPGSEVAEVRIEGIDDAGVSSAGAVVVTVPAQGARTLTARELESGEGEGLGGALGTGTGRWRLVVSSAQAIEVMSLIASAAGHLANVSTVPGPVGYGEGGASTVHLVPWLPPAQHAAHGGVQGVVRIVNRSGDAGEVRIEGYDDAGVASAVVAVALGAREAVELTSEELEGGSAEKGLSGGIGAGEGDWWLRLTTSLDIEVGAYVRAHDGALSSVHDVVARVGGAHRVGTFNPAGETSQASRLRIVNPGAEAAEVRIEGIDDGGRGSGGAVTFTLAAGAVRTLGAVELESGEGVSGGLGDGEGRWRLEVSADAPIEVMSPLVGPGGHLSNLSTTPRATEPPESAEGVFAAHVSAPVVQGKCVACHVEGGRAGTTRLLFEPETHPEHQALNLRAFEDLVAAIDDGADYILNKVQGVGHGGGVQVAAGTVDYENMERFLALLGEEVTAVAITPQTLFETVTMAPVRKTLRRAALLFAGRTPTEAEYAAAQGGSAALRETIRGLMTGPEFHEFLIRGANDRLLTDREDGIPIDHAGFVDYINERYRLRKDEHESNDVRDSLKLDEWYRAVEHGTRRAPLELIAHVVENDLPYTEILTADYIMANPATAGAYGAATRFDDPTDPREFKPSIIESYYRRGDGFEEEHDPVLDVPRILNPGPLSTEYPHAGILNTTVFLRRYPTTATNRNRARSRWTYYHFLGLDIEKSASRTTDPEALADTNNPTMHNPACTVCHVVLDPVAGVFQNYGDEGWYKDQWGGLDSLDGLYKDQWTRARETYEITAQSRSAPQTVSVTAWLPAGSELVRIRPRFDPPRRPDDSEFWWNMGIEHVTVRDGNGGLVDRVELETLAGDLDLCGSHEPRYDRGTGRSDAYYEAWFCTQRFPVEIPADGTYRIEVVVWVAHQHQDVANRRRMLTLSAGGYQEGDTWYRDVRVPGFSGKQAPSSSNSVQWLAEQIVADRRFAEAAVKFWWPAIMGSEVAEPPEVEGDADFEGRLLAATAQGAEVERLARGFRYGFRGGLEYNLKDLLVEIVLSKWFRADAVTDGHQVRRVALRDAGARRLLTPEELARKTSALTGFEWGRRVDLASPWRGISERRNNNLTDDFRLFYGGIDSDGITVRARDITSVMAGVAKTHATQASCPIVMRELFLLPDAERRLFSGIDKHLTPILEMEAEFEVKASSFETRETISVTGLLAAAPANVKLTFTNDYWEPPNSSRNIRLDRLDLRDAENRVVASHELEDLEPAEHCNYPVGDHFALHCNGSVNVPIDVPAAGEYTVEIVAWADRAGDALPRLNIRIESETEDSEGARAIRGKLVELYDKLLGVQVTPHSPDVDTTYRLFVQAWRRNLESENGDTNFRRIHCDWHRDILFYDGLANDVLVAPVGDRGQTWLDFDHERVNDYLDSIDFEDPEFIAETWIVVLAYLLMDYRYLYL